MQTSENDPGSYFNNILLATDLSIASQAAFQTALGVCNILHAKLTILHVFEHTKVISPEAGRQLFDLDKVYAAARTSLDSLARVAQLAGVPSEAILSHGLAPQSILETICSRQIGLTILGTNALHGFERLVFGSTAESVLRAAPCPVLTVGRLAFNPIKASQSDGPIIFPTDFHESTMYAIRYAASFCEATSSPLHCLHVLPRTVEGGCQSQIVPQIMTDALQQIAAGNGTTIGPPVCAITYGSEISNAVVNYARQHQAKLIVLGVRQASMMASHVPVHIAIRIITEAPCPVLTMAFT
jgi:nucleotide-binding universal stress UspA family protein